MKKLLKSPEACLEARSGKDGAAKKEEDSYEL
jgi:hypothetical protein